MGDIVALAGARGIAPSELTKLPVPAPANGHTDSTTEAVRLAVDAIEANHPGGLVLPVAALRDQVAQIHQHQRACRFTEVATDLPGLIRNLHTTLATGANHTELLDLAIYLHTLVTRLWLWHSSAPDDLIRRVVFLAHRLAQERDEVSSLAVAEYSVADVLIAGGALETGQATLDSLTLPPITAGTAGFVATATGCHAAAAVLAGRPGEAAAPMDAAVEIAGQFEADSRAPVPEPTDAGTDRFRFVTGRTTAGRWPDCGDVTTTRCGPCAAPRRSIPIVCSEIRSSAMCSPSCSPRPAVTPPPSGSCARWPTGPACPNNPSG